jgi:hypothetical protein
VKKAHKHLETAKASRLKFRLAFLKVIEKSTFLLMCLSAGFLVYGWSIPQQRHLHALEKKLQLTKQHEKQVLADLEYHQIEFRALKTDPTFLEIHARDRLNYYREGERVLRFSKNP